MRMDRLTTTAQQALADAQSLAVQRSHPEVAGLHVLSALLSDRSGPAFSVIAKAGSEPARVAQVVDAEWSRLPTTSERRAL